jgi:hypothetical protein
MKQQTQRICALCAVAFLLSSCNTPMMTVRPLQKGEFSFTFTASFAVWDEPHRSGFGGLDFGLGLGNGYDIFLPVIGTPMYIYAFFRALFRGDLFDGSLSKSKSIWQDALYIFPVVALRKTFNERVSVGLCTMKGFLTNEFEDSKDFSYSNTGLFIEGRSLNGTLRTSHLLFTGLFINEAYFTDKKNGIFGANLLMMNRGLLLTNWIDTDTEDDGKQWQSLFGLSGSYGRNFWLYKGSTSTSYDSTFSVIDIRIEETKREK